MCLWYGINKKNGEVYIPMFSEGKVFSVRNIPSSEDEGKEISLVGVKYDNGKQFFHKVPFRGSMPASTYKLFYRPNIELME